MRAPVTSPTSKSPRGVVLFQKLLVECRVVAPERDRRRDINLDAYSAFADDGREDYVRRVVFVFGLRPENGEDRDED